MDYILIKHRVKSFNKWKSLFDSFLENRRNAGELSYRIFVTAGEPNNLILLVEWDNYANFREFFDSEEVRKLMINAGVIGTAEVFFLNEIAAGRIQTEATFT